MFPLIKLYTRYLKEMMQNYDLHYSDEAVVNAISYYTCEGGKYHDIILAKGGKKYVGFIIVGSPPDCHPECDRYICHIYITPKLRRQGIMQQVLADYIAANPGRYCMDVNDGNLDAERFFHRVFTGEEYEEIELEPIKHGEKKGTTFFYEPKNKLRKSPAGLAARKVRVRKPAYTCNFEKNEEKGER